MKRGIHSGPTLAVAANNQLDYFGQTVNISNRVQAVAMPGEIVITEPVYSAPGVKELLAEESLSTTEKVELKGISEEVSFCRVV